MNLRQPINPVVQNALIMLASGLLASALCTKVYGATLPVDEPQTAQTAKAPVTAPAPRTAQDAAAAAQLRAMLAGQPILLGTPSEPSPQR